MWHLVCWKDFMPFFEFVSTLGGFCWLWVSFVGFRGVVSVGFSWLLRAICQSGGLHWPEHAAQIENLAISYFINWQLYILMGKTKTLKKTTNA